MVTVIAFSAACDGISDCSQEAHCGGEVSEPDERERLPRIVETKAAAIAESGKVGVSGPIDNCACPSTQGNDAVGDIHRGSGNRSCS
jgi:hypothetical protein